MSTPAEEAAIPEGPPAAEARLRARVPLKPVRKRKSPASIIFREREEVGYSRMWVSKPEALPKVAVISMTVEDQPEVNKDSTIYHDLVRRNNIVRNMRLFLRVAGSTHHSLLVLILLDVIMATLQLRLQLYG
ncbi:hypothetical protein N7451_000987 [Penicillium sp. IBT 35674x]|nr:hypothetical protein N7451_000987 [Penicillium sp. IBT 35674x]